MANSIPVLKSILSTKAAWRRHMAKTYPSDSRNTTSSELLDSLASEADGNVPADLIVELDDLSAAAMNRAASETAVRTGFRVFPRSLAEFVELTLAEAGKQRAERQAEVDALFTKGAE
jgi:hypothetical protein